MTIFTAVMVSCVPAPKEKSSRTLPPEGDEHAILDAGFASPDLPADPPDETPDPQDAAGLEMPRPPVDMPDAGSESPELPPVDPNALQFGRDILPIFEAHCTECHHGGRFPDLTDLSTWPADRGAVVDRILTAASTTMPPPPRDRLTAAQRDTIRMWKDQGLVP